MRRPPDEPPAVADTAPATGVRALVSQIDRQSGVPVWRQIAADIEAEILSGRLKPGTRLETEAELSAHFGVNRHTLRRALAVLAAGGLVTATPRRGTFVATARLSYPIARNTRFSENVAVAGRAPGGRLLEAKRVLPPPEIADWLAIPVGTPVIQMRHVRLANDTPICLTTAWFPADRVPRIAQHFRRSGSITKALASHGIVEYRRSRTCVAARQATPEERDALALPRNGLVLVTQTLDVDASGRPVQVAETRFAAERVELLIET